MHKNIWETPKCPRFKSVYHFLTNPNFSASQIDYAHFEVCYAYSLLFERTKSHYASPLWGASTGTFFLKFDIHVINYRVKTNCSQYRYMHQRRRRDCFSKLCVGSKWEEVQNDNSSKTIDLLNSKLINWTQASLHQKLKIWSAFRYLGVETSKTPLFSMTLRSKNQK